MGRDRAAVAAAGYDPVLVGETDAPTAAPHAAQSELPERMRAALARTAGGAAQGKPPAEDRKPLLSAPAKAERAPAAKAGRVDGQGGHVMAIGLSIEGMTCASRRRPLCSILEPSNVPPPPLPPPFHTSTPPRSAPD